ncbi:MAG: hypothetical protein ACI9EF_002611, partial [Pseudohongiellaceae bacterium]
MRLALALLAAALVALIGFDGGHTLWSANGPQTFGRPAFLGPLLWLTSAAIAGFFVLSPNRLALARRMALVVTGLCLFGGSVVPAIPGLASSFCGATLIVAAPWIRLGVLGKASLALLALCLPACLSTDFPGGVPTWVVAMSPALTLAFVLPSLFPGKSASQAAKVVVAVTAVISLAGLLSYPLLAEVLDLPLLALVPTRLRLLGHHPNLVVPGLTLAILIAVALACRPGARWERWALLPMGAALLLIGSRTGLAALLAGLGLLALTRLVPKQRNLWHGLAVVAVLGALLVPALGLTDRSIGHRSSQTLTKALTFRASMWRLGRNTVQAAPWTGHGPGTQFMQKAHVVPGRYDILAGDDHPHNTALAVGASF